MSEVEKQEEQKTVVAFIAGLLIGGLLVWVFASPTETMAPDTESEGTEVAETTNTTGEGTETTNTTGATSNSGTSKTETVTPGDARLTIETQAAGEVVALKAATYPTAEGWVVIRDYADGNVGGILGAARYSMEQGLLPTEVELLRATEAGKTYAAVYFTEDGAINEAGKLYFDPRGDQQMDVILTEFTAN